jgi:predicted dehydrogenase
MTTSAASSTSNSPVRVALIGCGNRGVNALGVGINESSSLQLVAVCDVDRARADAAAARLGVPAAYDHRALLNQHDLHAVVVATSARWHVPVALDAVRAGKHLLVEKPLAESVAASRELVTAAEAAGVAGMMGYQGRFTDFALRMKEQAEAIRPIQGLITRQRGPFRIQFFFGDHFGGIMDHATHDIHLALWLMGGAPTAVMGSVSRGFIRGDDTIEFVSLIVELDGGRRSLTLTGSMHGPQTPNVVQLVGTRGTVTSLDRRTLRVTRHGGIVEPAPAAPPDLESSQVDTAGEADATAALLDHFADLAAGRTHEQRGATLREGMYAVAVTEAAVESARTGRRVELDLG